MLLDEEFDLLSSGLPIQLAPRKIENVTIKMRNQMGTPVTRARIDPTLPGEIIQRYLSDGYLHVYIEP